MAQIIRPIHSVASLWHFLELGARFWFLCNPCVWETLFVSKPHFRPRFEQACEVWVRRARSHRLARLHKNYKLLVSLFQASIWALNRRKGDTHKPDRDTVMTFNTSQQCADMLLLSLRLNRPAFEICASPHPPPPLRVRLCSASALIIPTSMMSELWHRPTEMHEVRCSFILHHQFSWHFATSSIFTKTCESVLHHFTHPTSAANFEP